MPQELAQITIFSAHSHYKISWQVDFTEIRECIRRKQLIPFDYRALDDTITQRTIRPLALTSFSPVGCSLAGKK